MSDVKVTGWKQILALTGLFCYGVYCSLWVLVPCENLSCYCSTETCYCSKWVYNLNLKPLELFVDASLALNLNLISFSSLLTGVVVVVLVVLQRDETRRGTNGVAVMIRWRSHCQRVDGEAEWGGGKGWATRLLSREEGRDNGWARSAMPGGNAQGLRAQGGDTPVMGSGVVELMLGCDWVFLHTKYNILVLRIW